jgi:hypothetical protein
MDGWQESAMAMVGVVEWTMMVCQSVVNWFASVLQEKRRCM